MKIELCEYNPNWQAQFDSLKQQLLLVIGDDYSIEHIGSTSVEGLCAKPTIDILIGIDRITDSELLIPKITQLGYDYIPEYENQMPERRYFQKLHNGKHLAHIHLVEKQSLFWKRHLFFRNRLRLDSKYRNQYAILKQALAQKEWQDRNDYAQAKSEFIQKVEEKLDAFQWETDRLIIKPPTIEDIDHLYLLWSNPVVMRYVGNGKPRTKHQTRLGLNKMINHYFENGFTLGCVFKKDTKEFIGRAGLIYLDYLKSNRDIEVGYMFKQKEWNKGYATECAKYFMNWGFKNIKAPRIVAVTYPNNLASQRVMKKCKMDQVGSYMYGDIKSVMFEKRNLNEAC